MDLQKILAAIKRGSAEIIGEAELLEKLKTGRPLKIKYGADPSAPDLHLGHTVALRKLRQLQELGHFVQFLIGDFTGRIGDPTGRSVTRPPLSPEQIEANAQTYQSQVFRVLRPDRTEVVFNSRWCQPMGFAEVIRLASQYTVARIMERDDFAKRFQEGRPIGLHELLYPLIQGYDSVVLQSDLEVCGTDQIFNCLVARALQQAAGQVPEAIIAMPLLEGLDGVQKMSKSLGNYVGIAEPPQSMFGKLMSVPDALMLKYYSLLTGISDSDLQSLQSDLENGRKHPREAKASLAWQLVAEYHSSQAATLASAEFDRIFKEGGLPENVAEFFLDRNKLSQGCIWILRLLQETGLTTSRAQAQRMVTQGAVQLNQRKIIDFSLNVEIQDGSILQIGKRKFVKIRLK